VHPLYSHSLCAALAIVTFSIDAVDANLTGYRDSHGAGGCRPAEARRAGGRCGCGVPSQPECHSESESGCQPPSVAQRRAGTLPTPARPGGLITQAGSVTGSVHNFSAWPQGSRHGSGVTESLSLAN
jgi:hypothetical protein